jgi:hypothetical protein
MPSNLKYRSSGTAVTLTARASLPLPGATRRPGTSSLRPRPVPARPEPRPSRLIPPGWPVPASARGHGPPSGRPVRPRLQVTARRPGCRAAGPCPRMGSRAARLAGSCLRPRSRPAARRPLSAHGVAGRGLSHQLGARGRASVLASVGRHIGRTGHCSRLRQRSAWWMCRKARSSAPFGTSTPGGDPAWVGLGHAAGVGLAERWSH